MNGLRSVFAPATGYVPPREFAEAREGLSRAQRREASRAVRRGVAAEDPATARFAAAKARWLLQNRQGTPLTIFFVLLVIGWAAIGVDALLDEKWVVGAIFVGFFLWGLRLLYDMRPAAFERARDAERLNRAVAERSGLAQSSATSEPPAYTSLETAASAVGLWIFYDLTFAALTSAVDGESLTLDRVLLDGGLFATFMIVFHLTWGREQNRRRAERPVG